MVEDYGSPFFLLQQVGKISKTADGAIPALGSKMDSSTDSVNDRWISTKAKLVKASGAKLQGLQWMRTHTSVMPASYRRIRGLDAEDALDATLLSVRKGRVIFYEPGVNLMKLYNRSNGVRLAERLQEATTFLRRFRGLMLTQSLPSDQALLIRPCRSVHTFFMRYAIDVLYLDEAGNIVGTDELLAPGRIGTRYAGARSVVELPAGTIRSTKTAAGHRVEFE